MKTIRTTKTVKLGDDLLVEITSRANEGDRLNITSTRGPMSLTPEIIERVAKALEEERNDRGDYRYVCVDHGYHHAYDCPTCRREQARAVERAFLDSIVWRPSVFHLHAEDLAFGKWTN